MWLSAARNLSTASAARSRRISQIRSGDAVAAALLAAVERRVGDLQHPIRQPGLVGRDLIEAAQAEARRHREALLGGRERRVRDRGPELSGDVEGRLVRRFRHDDRELLATDARHPVDPAAQSLLQPRAELLQDLIAGRVPERVVDVLEVIDVAQHQGQRARVARRPLDLAREMLAEETPARRARQVVGRRELAVLLHDEAQHRLELADAPRRAHPRLELALGHPPPDALVRSGENARLALGRVIDLGHVNDERRADEGPGAQFANQLRAIGDHARTELRLEAAQRLLLVREALDLEQIGRDPPFHVLAQRRVLKDEERLGWWHYAHHDRDSRRRALFAGRGLGRPSLEHTLDDRRVSPPGWHFDPLRPEAARTPGDYRL